MKCIYVYAARGIHFYFLTIVCRCIASVVTVPGRTQHWNCKESLEYSRCTRTHTGHRISGEQQFWYHDSEYTHTWIISACLTINCVHLSTESSWPHDTTLLKSGVVKTASTNKRFVNVTMW